MRHSNVTLSAALLFLISFGAPALAAEYTIAPGQSVRVGSDTVRCVSEGGGNADLFVGYKWYEGCAKNQEVTVRFAIDWNDKKRTEANCSKNGITGSVSSYRIGNEPCKSYVNFNYCHELVREIFGN